MQWKPLAFLDKDRTEYLREASSLYKIFDILDFVLVPVYMPVEFCGGLLHRRAPAVERVETPWA